MKRHSNDDEASQVIPQSNKAYLYEESAISNHQFQGDEGTTGMLHNLKDRDPALSAVIARGPLEHKLAEFVFDLPREYNTDRVSGSITAHNSSDKIALAILLRSSPALL